MLIIFFFSTARAFKKEERRAGMGELSKSLPGLSPDLKVSIIQCSYPRESAKAASKTDLVTGETQEDRKCGVSGSSFLVRAWLMAGSDPSCWVDCERMVSYSKESLFFYYLPARWPPGFSLFRLRAPLAFDSPNQGRGLLQKGNHVLKWNQGHRVKTRRPTPRWYKPRHLPSQRNSWWNSNKRWRNLSYMMRPG